jgi:DNA-binding MarR family transcriptional regulator
MQLLFASISRVTPRIAEEHLEAWRAVLNAHARLTARVETALAEAGLPQLAWYDVLWALHRAPGKALRMGELAEQVTISRSGLTRLVDRIEAEGLLARRPSERDRRAIDVVITPVGSALLRRMWPIYEKVLRADFESKLTAAEARTMSRALAKI